MLDTSLPRWDPESNGTTKSERRAEVLRFLADIRWRTTAEDRARVKAALLPCFGLTEADLHGLDAPPAACCPPDAPALVTLPPTEVDLDTWTCSCGLVLMLGTPCRCDHRRVLCYEAEREALSHLPAALPTWRARLTLFVRATLARVRTSQVGSGARWHPRRALSPTERR